MIIMNTNYDCSVRAMRPVSLAYLLISYLLQSLLGGLQLIAQVVLLLQRQHPLFEMDLNREL